MRGGRLATDDLGADRRSDDLDSAFRAHRDWLVRRLALIVGDAEEARDLAQEAFVRAAEQWPLPDMREPARWLSTVGVRLAIDERRRRRRWGFFDLRETDAHVGDLDRSRPVAGALAAGPPHAGRDRPHDARRVLAGRGRRDARGAARHRRELDLTRPRAPPRRAGPRSMTDDFDVSLRRRLEGLAVAVPVAPSGGVTSVGRQPVRARSGSRLALAGVLPVLAVVVIGAVVAGALKIGPGPDDSSAGSTDVANGPIEATTRSGNFELTIGSAKGRYAVGEPIDIEAALTYVTEELPGGVQIGHALGADDGPLGFGIEEPVIGELRLTPGTRDACARTILVPGEPLAAAFTKSAGWSGDDPSSDDYRAFVLDPVLRLGVGTWHVYAVASFSLGDCGPDPVEMRADLTIEVIPAAVTSETAPSSNATEPPVQPTPEPPGAIDLATRPGPDGACFEALGGGVLARNSRTGLGFAGYARSTEGDVIWPFGYSARIEDGLAVLVDAAGRIVAREGDPLRLSGGFIDTDDFVFAACGIDPWVGTPLTLATAAEPATACDPGSTRGILARAGGTGLGIADDADVVTPVRWPFGYTARVVHGGTSFDGVAVLFDTQDGVVAWEGAPVAFSRSRDEDGALAACQQVRRVLAIE